MKINDQSIGIGDQMDYDSTYKPFQIIKSPVVISRICEISKEKYMKKCKESSEFNLTHLLKKKKGSNIKNINQSRETYRAIKQKISSKLQGFGSKLQNLNISQILVWKQEILASFLTQFLQQIGKECREKADILLFVWNSIFHILEYQVQLLGKLSQKEQKQYLNHLLDNHKDYQSVIENLKTKMARKQKTYLQQQEFIKALVFNLRYKRKEINKLGKNIKFCNVKLNEIKDFYLDLQTQHIDLLSQNRDISKQNALNLLKRKQQVNHERRKQYKMKQSRKKLRFQIQSQLQNEDNQSNENVTKLKKGLKSTFDRYRNTKKKQKGKENIDTEGRSLHNLFDNTLQDFNAKIERIPDTESIIDFTNNIAFMDVATDMEGFQRDVEDVGTDMPLKDKVYYDIVSYAGVQTIDIKKKQKQKQSQGIQVDFRQLKYLGMSRVKVIDRSYLLQDYRNNKNKQQKLMFKIDKNINNNRQYISELGRTGSGQFRSQGQVTSTLTQTDHQIILDYKHISRSFRNLAFQNQIRQYMTQIQYQQKQKELEEDIENRSSTGQKAMRKKVKSSLKTRRIRVQNSTSRSLHLSSSAKSESLKNYASQLETTSKSNFLTNRTTATSHHTLEQQERKSIFKQSRGHLKRKKINNFDTIEQNMYENLVSKDPEAQQVIQKNQQEQEVETVSDKIRKFWVIKPQQKQSITQKKQKFLKELNKGDQVLSKKSTHWKAADNLHQNRKLINQLQKLSQQFSNNTNKNLDLIQDNLNDNILTLTEQLRKMMNKKRNPRPLPLARQKSLCRIISFVYTYAYHLYFNHNKELYSLMIPLFHYFKIGYGEIKKNDLYLRMLYFLSQVICHQSENYLFSNFIKFLGLNFKQQKARPVDIQATGLYLRLLHSLSINFSFPLEVEQLYTTIDFMDSKCKQILVKEHFSQILIEKIIDKVKNKFHSMGNNWQQEDNKKIQFKEMKLNVFKCCQMVIEEIQSINIGIQESYTCLLNSFQIFQEDQFLNFLTYLLNNLYLPNSLYAQKLIKIKKQANKLKCKDKSERRIKYLTKVLLQLNIPDFNKLYFMVLANYKIKEEFLYLSLNRRLQFMLNYLNKNEAEFDIERKIIKSLGQKTQTSPNRQITNKKIMALAYLRTVQHQAQHLHSLVIGDSLTFLSSMCIQPQTDNTRLSG